MNNEVMENSVNNQINTQKKKKGPVIVIILLIIVIAGLGTFIYLKKDAIFKETNCEVKNTTNTNNNSSYDVNDVKTSQDDKNYLLPIFDEKNIVGNENGDYKYTLISFENSFNVHYEFDKKKVVIKSVKDDSSSIDLKDLTINNIKANIADVYMGLFNQTYEYSTMLFLLEDGTLDYMPMYYAFTNKDVKSYGKVTNIENVVKLYQASKDSTSYAIRSFTVLAQTRDGKIYDLGVDHGIDFHGVW